ncbi:MAG: phosphogluconate dehydrogenase (NAD(+)-dependent, decarboxylating) [Actinomycetota bacterium]
MQLGMVGLGRMGSGMTERLRRGGHEVTGYDRNPDVSEVDSLESLVNELRPPRVLWMMIPAGEVTERTVRELTGMLEPGDVLVDGGNSNFRDSIQRAKALERKEILFVDCGTSGGVWGLRRGFCLMVGGTEEAFARLEPILRTLAPKDGYAHVGPSGAGHFVKMVHNGIEYGLLQAYAEGFEILRGSKLFPHLDLHQVAEVWRHGSVIQSWLLDLAERALAEDPELADITDQVEDSGEGRWTVLEAIEEDVPAPITAISLFRRFASRQEESFALKMVAALRNQFGGHPVRRK